MRNYAYYSICSVIIATALLFLSYSNLRTQKATPPNIVIIGCSLQSAILVDQLLLQHPQANITILEQQQCIRVEQSLIMVDIKGFFYQTLQRHGYRRDKHNTKVGMWDNNAILYLDTTATNNIYEFGLSSYALKHILNDFANKINKAAYSPPRSLEEWIEKLGITLNTNTLKYLISQVGLDKEYVRKVVYPFLYGRTLQDIEMNILTAKLKLLGLCFQRYKIVASETDLIPRLLGSSSLHEEEAVREIRREGSNYTVVTTRAEYPNITAVIYCNKSKDVKDGFYRSRIRGTLVDSYYKTTNLPDEIYSLNNLALIVKECTNKCRKDTANLYQLRSKNKPTDKDFKMFTDYTLLASNKTRNTKYNLYEIPRVTDRGITHFNHYYQVSEDSEFISAAAYYLVTQIFKVNEEL